MKHAAYLAAIAAPPAVGRGEPGVREDVQRWSPANGVAKQVRRAHVTGVAVGDA